MNPASIREIPTATRIQLLLGRFSMTAKYQPGRPTVQSPAVVEASSLGLTPAMNPIRRGERSRVKPGMTEKGSDNAEWAQIIVDNIPISAILRSLFTQEGTLPERSVAGWGGGACAGGVPIRRPGRPPESGLAQQAKAPLPGVVSLPALDYAGAVSESALRRAGEGRSPMDPRG